jgi:FkbM family methyltransferase
MIHSLVLFLEKLVTRTYFYKVNKFMYILSLKGLGIDNQPSIVEKAESGFLNKSLSDKTKTYMVIDVGANIGKYSATVKQLAPSAKVYAFEPHPDTFEKLKTQAAVSGFSPIKKGCGAAIETLTFYDYLENTGSEHASLLKDVIEDIHHSKSVSYQIEVTTIDSFIKEEHITHIDLLKIDTEGYEYNVLKGCEYAIKNNLIDTIHFEFNSMNIISRVYLRDFIKLLPGYKLYRLVGKGLIPIETDKVLMAEIFGFQNIIAKRS